MLKTQLSFSPLECGLCKENECMYKECYESLYNTGKKIMVTNCKRMREEKRKGRIDL